MVRLKECRIAAGMTQQYVALTLGVKAPSVSNWESGKTLPTADNLIALANLYGVTIDYLLGRDVFSHKKSPFTDQEKAAKGSKKARRVAGIACFTLPPRRWRRG